MRLFDRVTYIGSDPLKQNYGAGQIIDMLPFPLRPQIVTVRWANMTPTHETIAELSYPQHGLTTGIPTGVNWF